MYRRSHESEESSTHQLTGVTSRQQGVSHRQPAHSTQEHQRPTGEHLFVRMARRRSNVTDLGWYGGVYVVELSGRYVDAATGEVVEPANRPAFEDWVAERKRSGTDTRALVGESTDGSTANDAPAPTQHGTDTDVQTELPAIPQQQQGASRRRKPALANWWQADLLAPATTAPTPAPAATQQPHERDEDDDFDDDSSSSGSIQERELTEAEQQALDEQNWRMSHSSDEYSLEEIENLLAHATDTDLSKMPQESSHIVQLLITYLNRGDKAEIVDRMWRAMGGDPGPSSSSSDPSRTMPAQVPTDSTDPNVTLMNAVEDLSETLQQHVPAQQRMRVRELETEILSDTSRLNSVLQTPGMEPLPVLQSIQANVATLEEWAHSYSLSPDAVTSALPAVNQRVLVHHSGVWKEPIIKYTEQQTTALATEFDAFYNKLDELYRTDPFETVVAGEHFDERLTAMLEQIEHRRREIAPYRTVAEHVRRIDKTKEAIHSRRLALRLALPSMDVTESDE